MIEEIKCPNCGNTNIALMEHVEDVESTRSLIKLEDGVLYYSADSYEHLEFASNQRLQCRAGNCFEKFPIPKGLKLDTPEY